MRKGIAFLTAIFLAILLLTGCETLTPAQRDALVGALAGSALGAGAGAIAAEDSGKGALAGGVAGAVAGGLLGHEIGKGKERDMAQDAAINQAIQEANTVTINIENSNGSITPVMLRREGNIYIGPDGEQYLRMPTKEQLEARYKDRVVK